MELTEIFSTINFKPYIINNIIDNEFLAKIKLKLKTRENMSFGNFNQKNKTKLKFNN